MQSSAPTRVTVVQESDSRVVLNRLIECCINLEADYHDVNTPYQNEDRKRQINEITALHIYIKNLISTSPRDDTYTDQQLISISAASWVYILESIDADYWVRKPDLKYSIFSILGVRGSTLYSLGMAALALTPDHKLDDQSRFIYLVQLHYFVMNNDFPIPQFIPMLGMSHHIEKALSAVSNRLAKTIDKIIHSIPTEQVLNGRLSTLYNTYLTRRSHPSPFTFLAPAQNQDRPFCAQLAEAVAKLLKEKSRSTEEDVDRDAKIQLGLLIYMLRTIPAKKGIKKLTSTNNSQLYEICKEMLNCDLNLISPHNQLTCLRALDRFLHEYDMVNVLYEKGKELFKEDNCLKGLDEKLAHMSANIEIESLILAKQIDEQASTSHTAATVGGVVGAVLMYTPGYGVGTVLGHVLVGMETNMNAGLKRFASDRLNMISRRFGAGGLGYIATTPFFDAIYKEAAGMALGLGFAAGGGVLGYVAVGAFEILLALIVARLTVAAEMKDPMYLSTLEPGFIAAIGLSHILSDETKKAVKDVAGVENGAVSEEPNPEKLLRQSP